MLKLKKILTPYDSSNDAQRALSYALDLARRTSADLDVAAVNAMLKGGNGRSYTPPCVPLTLEHLRRAIYSHQDSRALDPGQIGARVLLGRDVATCMLDYSEQNDVDLIVVSTRDEHDGPGTGLGSVAESVIRGAPCPVLAVREREAAEASRIRQILVPVDFSEYSTRALLEAREIGAAYGASLVLLFVAEEQYVINFSDATLPAVSNVPPSEDTMTWAGEALRQAAEWAGLTMTDAECHLAIGRPAQQIAAFAQNHAIDLIVMSTHGKGALRYFPLGSVTEAVCRLAPCPVLTLRAFGKSLVAPVESEREHAGTPTAESTIKQHVIATNGSGPVHGRPVVRHVQQSLSELVMPLKSRTIAHRTIPDVR